MRNNKKRARKVIQKVQVSTHGNWTVSRGKLVPAPGRPGNVLSIFEIVAEKIPFECLRDVEHDMKAVRLTRTGIYLAHDSMGVVRYAGLGQIFYRLRERKKKYPLQLHYFSFYALAHKKHQRELETLVIRATSHLLDFNTVKKHSTIEPGSVRDYEAGTLFYQRQKKRGRVAK
jgi:hypothetical protein